MFSLLSTAKLYPAATPPDPDPVLGKWNPGNYIASTTNDTNSIWAAFKTRLAAKPQWKGVVLRYDWNQLERAQGEYEWTEAGVPKGFLDIDRRINELQTPVGSRKLMILITLKTGGGVNDRSVPNYMQTSGYYSGYTDPTTGPQNGEFFYQSNNDGLGGWIPAMYIPAVRQRFEALMTAIGAKYNNSAIGEHLEAVMTNELSITRPALAITQAQILDWTNTKEPGWFNNFKTAMTNVRPALSRTNMIVWTNSPRNRMATLIPALQNIGVGTGMTDLVFRDKSAWYNPTDTPSTGPGNIYHCRQGQGRVPISGHASNPALDGSVGNRQQVLEDATSFTAYVNEIGATTFPAFDRTKLNTGGGTPYQPKQYIRDKSVNYVGVTHLLWAHSPLQDQDGLGTKAQRVDAWIGDPGSTITTVTARPTGW